MVETAPATTGTAKPGRPGPTTPVPLLENLTPAQTVVELDKYIIGQNEAKRAVAVALRNRYRRQLLPEQLRREVQPKNILMIGPTGVGKTEIARRVARLIDAPFIKVEATKFTEVGYVGRDVESIVRDLTEAAVNLVHTEKMGEVQARAEQQATERILQLLVEQRLRTRTVRHSAQANGAGPVEIAPGSGSESASGEDLGQVATMAATAPDPANAARTTLEKARARQRRQVARLLAAQQLEEEQVEIEIDSESTPFANVLEFMPG